MSAEPTSHAFEGAEMETAFTEYRAWVANGRSGAISHVEMVAELLSGPRVTDRG